MKLLLAPNAFKDSLSAREACEAMRRGALRVFPDALIKVLPVADGGDGTLAALCATENRLQFDVADPLHRIRKAEIGLMRNADAVEHRPDRGITCIIEIAQASGLALLHSEERNPWLTSSRGSGELIHHALELGANHILIGLGGSATNDCGAGLLAALGAIFLNRNNQPVQPTGGNLDSIHKIDLSGLNKRLTSVSLTGLCDVDNPLTGSYGASHIYASQKGADKEMIKKLDGNVQHFATLLQESTGRSFMETPGAGAAGGIGAAILALGGNLQPGFAAIANLLGLEGEIKNADLVLTGEGKTDNQTESGKAPAGVIALAKQLGKPAILISGSIPLTHREIPVFSTSHGPESLESALQNAGAALESTTARVLQAVALGMQLK
ncbi:MAG: glycerate kinase [Leptospirales bacterium]|nr:glycerate kinase [Leptospirales bacterium]